MCVLLCIYWMLYVCAFVHLWEVIFLCCFAFIGGYIYVLLCNYGRLYVCAVVHL